MDYRILPALAILLVSAACSLTLAGMTVNPWTKVNFHTDQGISVGAQMYSLFRGDGLSESLLIPCAFLFILASILEFVAVFVMLPIFCAPTAKEAREMQKARAIGAAVITLIAALATFAAFGNWIGHWNHEYSNTSLPNFSLEYGLGLWLTLVAAILALAAFVVSVVIATRPTKPPSIIVEE